MNFQSLKVCPFPCLRPRTSGEYDELASDVISGMTMFVSEKICEHAIVCFKIVAYCKEYVLLEAVVIHFK